MSLSFPVLIVSVNFYLNEFGLFGNIKGKEYRVYNYEKTTKYLFSFNYIPSNFDSILVGPSMSDRMMDTEKLNNYRVYNLSMDGGNISELKYAIDNVLNYGNIKLFIICLDPFITKDSGTKSSQINTKEYYSTLGSLFTLKHYTRKAISIRLGKKDMHYDSYWGYINNAYNLRDNNSTLDINKYVNDLDPSKIDFLRIDETAYKELSEVLATVRKKDIQILAYYYPRPKRIAEHNLYKLFNQKYKKKIDKLLDYDRDIIVDFSQNKYDYIRDDDSSYYDGGHLSRKGADKILEVLNNKILDIKKPVESKYNSDH